MRELIGQCESVLNGPSLETCKEGIQVRQRTQGVTSEPVSLHSHEMFALPWLMLLLRSLLHRIARVNYLPTSW